MHHLIGLKTTARPLLMTLTLLCLGLLPQAQAVSPAPDGGYPGLTTAEGHNALFSLTSGAGNTAVGWFSLKSVTTGSFNTGVGAGALVLNTGDSNTATGTVALLLNTTGARNTANGTATLVFNSTGTDNTAVGFQALNSNTTASGNTALGSAALFSNTTGTGNTALGQAAMGGNTIGTNNTGIGWFALVTNTTGGADTAVGYNALTNDTSIGANTAVGAFALSFNTTGFQNTAIGGGALFNNTTGNDNIALGDGAGIGVGTANNVICIGAAGADLGNSCYIGQIFGQPVDPATAVPVFVDTNGKLGTAFSSRRFKHDIKPMDKASETILALKPVTFQYKSDKTDTPQFGLIAEEVAKVNPALVVRDKNGEIYTVRYDQVNAMLLNEFLKEHQKVQDLEKQVEKLIAGLEKVSAELEASKPAPQVVNNP
jgi:hypothetical protein